VVPVAEGRLMLRCVTELNIMLAHSLMHKLHRQDPQERTSPMYVWYLYTIREGPESTSNHNFVYGARATDSPDRNRLRLPRWRLWTTSIAAAACAPRHFAATTILTNRFCPVVRRLARSRWSVGSQLHRSPITWISRILASSIGSPWVTRTGTFAVCAVAMLIM
jgi:hypothetical protein